MCSSIKSSTDSLRSKCNEEFMQHFNQICLHNIFATNLCYVQHCKLWVFIQIMLTRTCTFKCNEISWLKI